MLKTKLLRAFLKKLDQIEFGSLRITTPDNNKYEFCGSQAGPDVQLQIKKWSALFKIILDGDAGILEAYMNDDLEISNLEDLFVFGIQNENSLNNFASGFFLNTIKERLRYFFQQNSISNSKKNIHQHYDLGNEFYQLWLDDTMTYSSALYKNKNENLKSAQFNKYKRILDLLEQNTGNLLEIGCGWGGFIDKVNQSKNFNCKGITVSKQQYDYVQKNISEGSQFHYEDYRHQTGKYDYIVSIEMLEAVGEKYWNTYFSKIKSLLKGHGKCIIQTITIDDELFDSYRLNKDIIRSYIFPGGLLPSLERIKAECKKNDLYLLNNFNFGNSYAQTLKVWRKNVIDKTKKIKALGFDDKFLRLWDFYLSYCIAGFKTQKINVTQLELKHA